MAEERKITYAHAELAALMIKDKGLHEGLWHLQVQFGLSAVNAGPSDQEMNPTAVVPVLSIGLVSVTAPGPLVFDAALVNPL
jgi:hypothetical protein